MSNVSLVEVRPEMYDMPAPPAVPTVLLDPRLGIQPEEIGFNFETFYDLARTAGLNGDQISAYRHTFSADLSKTDRLGHYIDDVGSTVYVRQCVKAAEKLPQMLQKRSAQKRFGADVYHDTTLPGIIREVSIHEFGHYVDAQIGDPTRARRIERIKGCAAAVVVMSGAMDIIYSNSTEASFKVYAFGAAAIMLSAAGEMRQAKRADSPTERPAYNFQERYKHAPIVHFDEAALMHLQ